jgi:A/G-specific adenine glycosylase
LVTRTDRAHDSVDSLLDSGTWAALRAWYASNGRHNLPWRHDRTPWRVLIAETLLHRTRADAVAGVYPPAVVEFPNPGSVLDRPDRWRDLLRPIGLSWRTEAFVQACASLVSLFNSEVPPDAGSLQHLPGVGHYVARAVMCFGFGRSARLVDANTIRLASRISGDVVAASAHRTRRIQDLVGRLSENGRSSGPEDNFALLDLAAIVCLPAKPRCMTCPVQRQCITGTAHLATSPGPEQTPAADRARRDRQVAVRISA